ncbi:hypothetical protein [Croceimicrobium sp.]|uniref:hypothetical protein n=1 Tax=Croceimicrobium sp. TaxID=2828340 RepID=UPI003BAD36D6
MKTQLIIPYSRLIAFTLLLGLTSCSPCPDPFEESLNNYIEQSLREQLLIELASIKANVAERPQKSKRWYPSVQKLESWFYEFDTIKWNSPGDRFEDYKAAIKYLGSQANKINSDIVEKQILASDIQTAEEWQKVKSQILVIIIDIYQTYHNMYDGIYCGFTPIEIKVEHLRDPDKLKSALLFKGIPAIAAQAYLILDSIIYNGQRLNANLYPQSDSVLWKMPLGNLKPGEYQLKAEMIMVSRNSNKAFKYPIDFKWSEK